jgi:hypothetical protein
VTTVEHLILLLAGGINSLGMLAAEAQTQIWET